MALKITTQIGTDRGITSEAYLRISDYRVSKYGRASFITELFLSQEDSVSEATIPVAMYEKVAQNRQIGDMFMADLYNEEGRPDLSPLVESGIFAFGYGVLKAKLENLFGAENVVDC